MEVTTGKSQKERMIKNITKISDLIQMTLALQSMNPPTLKKIKRTNFSVDDLLDIMVRISPEKMRVGCELIIPMPEETYQTYLEAFRYCVDLGMKVHTHTLILYRETEMAQAKTLKAYDMETKYRVLYRCFGTYGRQHAIETEKVCVATRDYCFSDYVQTRTLGCINAIFLLNEMFQEMRMFILQEKLSTFDWLMSCYRLLEEKKAGLWSVISAFKDESVGELWDTEEELFDYFNFGANFDKLARGEIGRNLITTYQGIAIEKHYQEAVLIAKESLMRMLQDAGRLSDEGCQQVDEIASYLMLQNADCFDVRERAADSRRFEWNICQWSQDSFARPLRDYRKQVKLSFSQDSDALSQVKHYITQYGDHPEGYGRILVRMNPELLKRKVVCQ